MLISIVTISTAFAEEGNINANADAAVAKFSKFRRVSDTAPSSSLGIINAQRGDWTRDGGIVDIVDIIVVVNASVYIVGATARATPPINANDFE